MQIRASFCCCLRLIWQPLLKIRVRTILNPAIRLLINMLANPPWILLQSHKERQQKQDFENRIRVHTQTMQRSLSHDSS